MSREEYLPLVNTAVAGPRRKRARVTDATIVATTDAKEQVQVDGAMNEKGDGHDEVRELRPHEYPA